MMNRMSDKRVTDYVVVGAGAAGSVPVRRLIDAGHRVTVIEAGPADTRPEIDDPFGAMALFGTELDWAFTTEPQVAAGGRRLYQPRGRALGGCTTLSGMVYVRGAAADYDAWAAAGADGWAWSDVEPYFRRLEDGPLHVQKHPGPDELTAAFLAAAARAGHPLNPDYNDGDSRGASLTQTTIETTASGAHRVTPWRAYTGPVADSPLLTVVTEATADRVLLDRGRAVGVEYRAGGETHTVHVEREVILSAGVFGTPHLLLRSGVGPAEQLRAAGVPVVADLPGVGANLRDHAAVPVVWEAAGPVPAPHVNGVEAHVISDGTAAALLQPDHQTVLVSSVYSTIPKDLPEFGFTGLAILLHPHSTGSVRLDPADPAGPPLIDLGLLTDERDVDSLVAQLEKVRAIGAQPELAKHINAERYPGSAALGTDDLRAYVRAAADAGHHQVGTARIGHDRLAVVDGELRVHGLAGLRVADASVMPLPPAGNTVGPAVMIGERIAAFLLG